MKEFGEPTLDGSIRQLYETWIWRGMRRNLIEHGKLTPVAFFCTASNVFDFEGTANISLKLNDRPFIGIVQQAQEIAFITLELDYQDEDSKATSAALVQMLTHQWKANFVGLVAEAWQVKHPDQNWTD